MASATGTRAPTTTTPRADEPSELAARLRLSATRLARQLRQQSDTGMTPSQLSALAAVDRHGPLTLGALADHERVSPPTITRVVAKLEADGLVLRQADPTDRRSALVATTAAGDELLTATRQRKDAWLTGRLGDLDADQRNRLRAALDVLDAITAAESGTT
jgi:DNA-binding MarR family transcriptional regulator